MPPISFQELLTASFLPPASFLNTTLLVKTPEPSPLSNNLSVQSMVHSLIVQENLIFLASDWLVTNQWRSNVKLPNSGHPSLNSTSMFKLTSVSCTAWKYLFPNFPEIQQLTLKFNIFCSVERRVSGKNPNMIKCVTHKIMLWFLDCSSKSFFFFWFSAECSLAGPQGRTDPLQEAWYSFWPLEEKLRLWPLRLWLLSRGRGRTVEVVVGFSSTGREVIRMVGCRNLEREHNDCRRRRGWVWKHNQECVEVKRENDKIRKSHSSWPHGFNVNEREGAFFANVASQHHLLFLCNNSTLLICSNGKAVLTNEPSRLNQSTQFHLGEQWCEIVVN